MFIVFFYKYIYFSIDRLLKITQKKTLLETRSGNLECLKAFRRLVFFICERNKRKFCSWLVIKIIFIAVTFFHAVSHVKYL